MIGAERWNDSSLGWIVEISPRSYNSILINYTFFLFIFFSSRNIIVFYTWTRKCLPCNKMRTRYFSVMVWGIVINMFSIVFILLRKMASKPEYFLKVSESSLYTEVIKVMMQHQSNYPKEIIEILTYCRIVQRFLTYYRMLFTTNGSITSNFFFVVIMFWSEILNKKSRKEILCHLVFTLSSVDLIRPHIKIDPREIGEKMWIGIL